MNKRMVELLTRLIEMCDGKMYADARGRAKWALEYWNGWTEARRSYTSKPIRRLEHLAQSVGSTRNYFITYGPWPLHTQTHVQAIYRHCQLYEAQVLTELYQLLATE